MNENTKKKIDQSQTTIEEVVNSMIKTKLKFAYQAGQEAKGSSWREGYQRGQEDILEKIEHENNKLLDGFNHPKDCEICNKLKN